MLNKYFSICKYNKNFRQLIKFFSIKIFYLQKIKRWTFICRKNKNINFNIIKTYLNPMQISTVFHTLQLTERNIIWNFSLKNKLRSQTQHKITIIYHLFSTNLFDITASALSKTGSPKLSQDSCVEISRAIC